MRYGLAWIAFIVMSVVVLSMGTFLRFEAVRITQVSNQINRGDAADYIRYAANMKEYGIYSRQRVATQDNPPVKPDALRSPGYPFFVSLFLADNFKSKPIEEALSSVAYAQAILGTITLAIWMYLLYRTVSPFASVVGGGIIAISPHLINICTNFLTESLFLFELTLFFLALFFYAQSRSRTAIFLAVIILAMASLTRPSTQYFIVPLLLTLYFVEPVHARLKLPLILGLLFVLALSPWSIRNKVSIGEFSDPTLQANFLQHGMYPDFMFDNREETRGYPYRFDPLNAEIYGNTGKVMSQVISRFEEAPLAQLKWYLLGKPYYLLSWNMIEGFDEVFIYPVTRSPFYGSKPFILSRVISKALHGIITIVAIVGIVMIALQLIRNRTFLSTSLFQVLIPLFVLYFVALHIVGSPFPRYGIPLRPLVVMLALQTVHYLWIQYQQHKGKNT